MMNPNATVWLSEAFHLAESTDPASPMLDIETSWSGDDFMITFRTASWDEEPRKMLVSREDVLLLWKWLSDKAREA